MREEAEYVAFRCVYCWAFNPAKKQRPTAPPMPTLTAPLDRSPQLAATPQQQEQDRVRSSSESAAGGGGGSPEKIEKTEDNAGARSGGGMDNFRDSDEDKREEEGVEGEIEAAAAEEFDGALSAEGNNPVTEEFQEIGMEPISGSWETVENNLEMDIV